MVTLFLGILISGGIGLYASAFDILVLAKTIYDGFLGMSEIFFLSLLTGGLATMVERAGGIEFLLREVNSFIKSRKTALLGIGVLVSVINSAVANNTIAILISGKVAKNISEKYRISLKNSASVLDIFACYIQGIVPYGAQILTLIAFSNHQIKYTDLFLNAYYLHLLLIITLIFIFLFQGKKDK